MTASLIHEVKPPSAVLAEDVICQSFIQSSSTLAYACLLIRRGRHDLAAHVLHSLESKPASRFKDMVFYLQAQIGIETGDFAAVKRRLAPRVHQHPNDMVALSLLAACVHLEWEDWRHRNPEVPARNPASVRTQASEAFPPSAPPASAAPSYHTLSVSTVPSAQAAFPGPLSAQDAVISDSHAALGRVSAIQPAAPAGHVPSAPPASGVPQIAPLNLNVIPPAPAPDAPYLTGDSDLGIYQALASDPNTLAMSLWNSGSRKLRTTSKRPEAEALVAVLPQALPFGLSEAVRALEGGEVVKACFAFQILTVTSLHAGPENLGLVTGNLNQSLLTMVRAENIFLKGTQGAVAAARVGAGSP